MKFRTAALASSALTLALILAGCSANNTGGMEGMDHGSDSPSDSATEADFNAADEMFTTGMIAHHQQAIDMAQMVLDKEGVAPQVAELAERIKAAQQPEIDLLESWLVDWGIDSGSMDDGMEGMDHGSDGMMSEEDMAALEAANGADASVLFLEQMIQHHEGAIAMAQTEVDNGVNADAVALAEKIINDQTAEITEMENLLSEL